MFACLYSLTVPVAALVRLAEDFTPRFEVCGPLVLLDASGLSRLFGTPREIGEQLRRASRGPVRIALAPRQTAAALLALGRPGLTVVDTDDCAPALASLPVALIAELERIHLDAETAASRPASPQPFAPAAPDAPGASAAPVPSAASVTSMPPVAAPTCGGWSHPRHSHAAAHMRRPRRAASAPAPLAPSAHAVSAPAPPAAPAAPLSARTRAALRALDERLLTLRRWGVATLGQLAALPPAEVYERMGAHGVRWQRLARGEDLSPLVPWVADEPFVVSLELEWPIEGLEPLSFVLARLLDPLSARLERADRGAAVLHTHLRLVDKTTHVRTLQLPSPMRDSKTLRTLVLLDLESHPPAAAIDVVRLLVEPTPGRVTQWALFERAQPSPEQVSTLLARLTALMGDSHVGSPRLVDSWKPGAFEMTPFAAPSAPAPALAPAAETETAPATQASVPERPASALRRFRLPVPARVQVQEGRPVRVISDRRGIAGGAVVQAAGPWRTSGEWWNDGPAARAWDRDEWDVALADGTVYRLFVERDIGQWFLDGIVD